MHKDVLTEWFSYTYLQVTSSEEKVSERKLGPTIPDHIKEAIEKTDQSSEVIEIPKTVNDSSVSAANDLIEESLEDDEPAAKKKRGDRGSKRKTKIEEVKEVKEDYYQVGMDSKYDVWLPPDNQSGDGKTSLNEKLGY